MEPIALTSNPELPDPLVMLNGQRIVTREDWFARRRPELKELFQYYMYGYAPAASLRIESSVEFVEPNYFGGLATLKEVTVRFGPATKTGTGTTFRDEKWSQSLRLLVAIPNRRTAPAPAFVGLNFCGNHAADACPRIALPQGWIPKWCPACVDNRACEAGRGAQAGDWPLERIVARGYAVATIYAGDIDPDRNDFTDGIHPCYYRPGQLAPEHSERLRPADQQRPLTNGWRPVP